MVTMLMVINDNDERSSVGIKPGDMTTAISLRYLNVSIEGGEMAAVIQALAAGRLLRHFRSMQLL